MVLTGKEKTCGLSCINKISTTYNNITNQTCVVVNYLNLFSAPLFLRLSTFTEHSSAQIPLRRQLKN